MSRSLSEAGLRAGFGLLLGLLVAVAAGFYLLQNNDALPGGRIAPVKLAWLGCAILFWYLLPALLLLDGRMPKGARRACAVLLAGMVLRGLAELYLMYATGNWHPWMGISHDLLMLLLMTATLVPLRHGPDRLYSAYLVVATLMFIPESLFAWYMLANATAPGETVYFIAGNAGHGAILAVTAICVSALLLYLIFFCRQWLYGQARRQLR